MGANQTSRCSRRAAVKAILAGMGSLAWPAPLVLPSAAWAAGEAAPSRKLNIAAIGTGGRCSFLIEEALRLGNNITALCDVDGEQLDRAAKMVAGRTSPSGKQPRLYEDYRKLIESEKSFDAALVATGSRWHAPISAALMKAGKHVYCEKPLVRKIAEARELSELAERCRVATQHGTHGGSSKAFRRSVEIIEAGLLGPVRHVHLWCDGYGQFPASHDRPPGEDPVPPRLNWDFWLGPSPWRPFKAGAYHPGCITFQSWLDLCNGMLAGQGAHTFYLPVRALHLEHPTRVEADRLEPLKETYVSRGRYRFEFPARGPLPPVTLWWMDGPVYPPEEVTRGVRAIGGKLPPFGCLFVGDQGELFAGGWGENGVMKLKGDPGWRGVLDHEAAKAVPVTLPRAPGDNHLAEWIQACQGGPATFTSFQIAARAAAAYLPGMVSLRLGRPIAWDGAAMKVPGLPEADPLIQKHYREKWLF